jgi:YVTN family beta-propeller protein
VLATVPVEVHPSDVEVVGSTLWVLCDRVLERFDLSGQTAGPPIQLASRGNDIVVAGDLLYVTQYDAKSVWVVDARSGTVIGDPIGIAGNPVTGTVLDDTVWITVQFPDDKSGGELVPIRDHAAGAPIGLPAPPNSVNALDGRLWITFDGAGLIAKFEPGGRAPEPTYIGKGPIDVQVVGGQLWVTVHHEDAVLIVDPTNTKAVRRIPVGHWPWKLAVGPGAVWVTNRNENGRPGSVSRIDPDTQTVTGTADLGINPDELAIGPNQVYVANYGGGTVSIVSPGSSS